MNLPNCFIYDFEVFAFDWLVVFKSTETGQYYVFHNDDQAVRDFMTEHEPLLCGFNSKHYDNHILKAVLCGCSPEEVKQVNDEIILRGIPGWNIPFLRDSRIWFESFDLMDDMQQGLSLKAIEAHLGMDIEESEVDFALDRPLTETELEQTIRYCKYDVDATEKLFHLRESYLTNKINIGRMRGLTDAEALYMTNPKLTAVYLRAQRPETFWNDERDYQYPAQLRKEYIPAEVFAYFDRLHDHTIPMEEIMGSRLEITVGDCPVTLGFGGIHGALPAYTEQAVPGRSIRNKDVASYYPNIMRLMGYCSRAMPDPQMYADIIATRVKAKKAGDKPTAEALKLVLNSTYGGMLNGQGDTAFNDLYDPLMARSVCISGQLFLLELTEHLVRECPTLKVIQLNTDGIMVSFDDADAPKWDEITQEWQDRTGFELEEDRISKIIQKDVNNYVEVRENGLESKVKGGMLVRGISPAGAFNVNNNAVVVAQAIRDYFVTGKDPKETIYEWKNILDFQLIAKASGKYSGCYQERADGVFPVQRCNRVYASKNRHNGTIYKIHKDTGKAQRIAGLPAHCEIDNKNVLTLDAVDRDWYVKLARKQIRDFLGIVPPKVNTKRVNALKRKCLDLLDGTHEVSLF